MTDINETEDEWCMIEKDAPSPSEGSRDASPVALSAARVMPPPIVDLPQSMLAIEGDMSPLAVPREQPATPTVFPSLFHELPLTAYITEPYVPRQPLRLPDKLPSPSLAVLVSTDRARSPGYDPLQSPIGPVTAVPGRASSPLSPSPVHLPDRAQRSSVALQSAVVGSVCESPSLSPLALRDCARPACSHSHSHSHGTGASHGVISGALWSPSGSCSPLPSPAPGFPSLFHEVPVVAVPEPSPSPSSSLACSPAPSPSPLSHSHSHSHSHGHGNSDCAPNSGGHSGSDCAAGSTLSRSLAEAFDPLYEPQPHAQQRPQEARAVEALVSDPPPPTRISWPGMFGEGQGEELDGQEDAKAQAVGDVASPSWAAVAGTVAPQGSTNTVDPNQASASLQPCEWADTAHRRQSPSTEHKRGHVQPTVRAGATEKAREETCPSCKKQLCGPDPYREQHIAECIDKAARQYEEDAAFARTLAQSHAQSRQSEAPLQLPRPPWSPPAAPSFWPAPHSEHEQGDSAAHPGSPGSPGSGLLSPLGSQPLKREHSVCPVCNRTVVTLGLEQHVLACFESAAQRP